MPEAPDARRPVPTCQDRAPRLACRRCHQVPSLIDGSVSVLQGNNPRSHVVLSVVKPD